MLEAASELGGFPASSRTSSRSWSCWSRFLLVIVAFFVMAVQIFVVLIEFKLTTLAGFVLVPFGLFGRTAFLAERVLGNVIASGVKVLVLAVDRRHRLDAVSEFTSLRLGRAADLERSWPWPWRP
jgi:type IV secretion system protein TrbL